MIKEFPWTSLDSKLLKFCSVKVVVTDAMKSIIDANSHSEVRLSTNRISMTFLTANSGKREQQIGLETTASLARQAFYSCDWKTAFER